ncbi:MAG: hypothetical protein RTU30_09620 [Candidatus Thorarchaeota archaeon]
MSVYSENTYLSVTDRLLIHRLTSWKIIAQQLSHRKDTYVIAAGRWPGSSGVKISLDGLKLGSYEYRIDAGGGISSDSDVVIVEVVNSLSSSTSSTDSGITTEDTRANADIWTQVGIGITLGSIGVIVIVSLLVWNHRRRI